MYLPTWNETVPRGSTSTRPQAFSHGIDVYIGEHISGGSYYTTRSKQCPGAKLIVAYQGFLLFFMFFCYFLALCDRWFQLRSRERERLQGMYTTCCGRRMSQQSLAAAERQQSARTSYGATVVTPPSNTLNLNPSLMDREPSSSSRSEAVHPHGVSKPGKLLCVLLF